MKHEHVALISGASRGIGRGIAIALGELNWITVINYCFHNEAASETMRLVEEAGGKALIVQADIRQSMDRNKLVDTTIEDFGRIDLLVNNAGVAPEQRADILETTEESYDEVMSVNLKGPFFLTQRVVTTMINQVESGIVSYPKIINISSISAYTSSTNRGEYCLSKAGMSMMTTLYADRLAEYGIYVYEIRPGIIETDMTSLVKKKYDRLIYEGLTPIKRWGQPGDIARTVVAIAEGYLSFSTGEVINVDGGFHLRRL